MATAKKTTPAQERAFSAFLEKQGPAQFRRQDLAKALYSCTQPRSLDAAKALAEVFMRRLANANRLVKVTNVHWRVVTSGQRTLKSGRVVDEIAGLKELPLSTHCPVKWVSVDLETGDIWVGSTAGWKPAPKEVRDEAVAVLAAAQG